MVKPMPDKVKDTLKELSSAQALVLRTYIGTLRADMKELEEQVKTVADPDPDAHAHYHGHEKCTADHGDAETVEHKSDGHAHDHKHGETCTADHDHSGHDHKEHEHKEHKHEHGHDHKEHDHKEHEHHEKKSHDHEHKHEHQEKKSHDHEHDHEKKSHDHDHKHDHHDDMPAWKKKALEAGAADPTAAPFGGNWNTESMVDAQKDKMKE
jgi:hypothetical protein